MKIEERIKYAVLEDGVTQEGCLRFAAPSYMVVRRGQHQNNLNETVQAALAGHVAEAK
jgi:hypothetical protein